jgi:uncharacterized membrane protein YfcA
MRYHLVALAAGVLLDLHDSAGREALATGTVDLDSFNADLPKQNSSARLEAGGLKPTVGFLQVSTAESKKDEETVALDAQAAVTDVLKRRFNALKDFYASSTSAGGVLGLLEVLGSGLAHLDAETVAAFDERSISDSTEKPATPAGAHQKTTSKTEALTIGLIAACAACFYAISGFGYAILFHGLWLCASLCGVVHGGVQRAVICIILAGPALVAMQMSMLMFTSRANPTNNVFCATWCTTTLLGVVLACVPMVGRRQSLMEHLLWMLFVVVCLVEWSQQLFKSGRRGTQPVNMSIVGVAASVVILGVLSGFGQGALAAGGGTKIIMVLCLAVPLDEWRIAATLADWPVHAVRFAFYHYHGDLVLAVEWQLACVLICGQLFGLFVGNYFSPRINAANVSRILLIFLTWCALQLTHKLLFTTGLWKTVLPTFSMVSLCLASALLFSYMCAIRFRFNEMRSSMDWYRNWVIKKQSSNYMQGWDDLLQACFGVATWWVRPPPSVWIVGEKKCGTTSLHWYLNRHENMLSGIAKEQHLFDCRNIFGWKFEDPDFLSIKRGFFPTSAHYFFRRLFSPHGVSTPVHCVDGTPTNLMLPWAASAIKQLHKGHQPPKIVVVLRDPVERAVSDYRYEVVRNKETRSFEDALEAEVHEDAWFWEGETWSQCVASESLKPMWEHERLGPDIGSRMPDEHAYRRRGNYLEHLRPYYQAFGSENITLVSVDELSSDPLGTVNNILTWLSLPPLQALDAEKKNVTPNEKSPRPIPADVMRRLAQNYAPGLAALQDELQFRHAKIWRQKWSMNDSQSTVSQSTGITPEAQLSEDSPHLSEDSEPEEPEAEPADPAGDPEETERTPSGKSEQRQSPAMYSTAPSTPELRNIM